MFFKQLSLCQPSSRRPHVTKFLNEPEANRLLVYFDGKDYTISPTAPAKFNKAKKTLFFVKIRSVRLTNDDMSNLVIAGEFGESPLEYLGALSEDVLMPVLSSPQNQQASDGAARAVLPLGCSERPVHCFAGLA